MKLDKDTVNKLEEAFAIDASVSEACYYADISRQTYYNWEKDNPELKEKFDRLKQKPILKARQEVIKGLNCYSNAMDYLKRKRKLEFGDNIDVTSDNKPIPLLNGQSNVTNNTSDKKITGTEEKA